MTARLVAVAAVGVALVAPATAQAGRYAVGLAPGVDHARVAERLERRGARVESLAPLPALVAVTDRPERLRSVGGVRYVEARRVRRTSFTPTDPLVAKQWYLTRVRAYDAWTVLPPLAPVRVAVIDSGVDLGHPDLAGRIAAAKSFVGGSVRDTSGHGTVVSGIIAAQAENGVGIAGLAPSAQLLVAKVVADNGSIAVEAEARAIRWAVAQGARVINMSLGGVRDPSNPDNDTYSRLEADAVAYAVAHGVVVVAAVGNSDQAPDEPWRFAFYPASLPHVLGVSAVGRDGSVPVYSNRDAVFNDLAAPGTDILSTFPRRLTAERPACADQGYTPCGTADFRPTDGTSFAAPQASAAAATLLATYPELRAEQVTAVLERSAVDARAATGCGLCGTGRDAFTGWGTLDIAAALELAGTSPPAPDALEPNDDTGDDARLLSGPWRRRNVDAAVDFWDDQDDVYGVWLRSGHRLDVSVAGDAGDLSLALWGPRSVTVRDLAGQRARLRLSARRGAREHVGFRAAVTGWHYVQVRVVQAGESAYRLTIART